jgi:hypothetical protein
MKNYLQVLVFLFTGVLSFSSNSAPLITSQEAALPAATGTLSTRGISRGPTVKLASPGADIPVSSPFDLKFSLRLGGRARLTQIP